MTGTAENERAAASAAISFRQVRLFEAVGRLGNISRAARECGLSQPAATQSLMLLSRKVGTPLLDGGTKGASLTPSGREFHARAHLLVEKLDRGLQHVGIDHREQVTWQISRAQIRLLKAVHERGSLERAIVATETNPRSAKRAVRLLEALLNQPITETGNGATILNAKGLALADQIGLLSDELDWIVSEVRARGDQAPRTVVLGVAADPGTASLNIVVKSFIERHPGWCIEIIEAAQNDLLARLAIGEVDFVLGHILEEPGERVSWRQLASVEFRIAARRGHLLARQRAVAAADLLDAPWIVGATGSHRRAASDALFAGRARPSCSLITSAAPLMAFVMADSDHLGMMTDRELGSRQDTLTTIAHGAPAIVARIGLATRAGWHATAAHDDVVELLVRQFADSCS